MRITITMILALTHIDWIRKSEDDLMTFSRKIGCDTINRLLAGGFVTTYEGIEFGKTVTKFKLTKLGKSVLA